MSLEIKFGTFIAPTSTGNFSVTGLGFQPKLVVFNGILVDPAYGDPTIGDPSPYVGLSWRIARGAMTADNQFGTCVGQRSGSNWCPSYKNTSACLYVGGASIEFQASYVSMDSDGFTINFSTVSTNIMYFSYTAFGGDAVRVTNAFEFATDYPTGVYYEDINQRPDFIWNISDGHFFSGTGGSTGSRTSTGFWGRRSDAGGGAFTQVSACAVSNSAITTRCKRRSRATSLIQAVNAIASPTVALDASVTRFDGEGFFPFYSVANITHLYPTMAAITGVRAVAGQLNTSTSTGNQSVTGIGFRPKAVLFVTYGTTGAIGIQSGFLLSCGGSDGTDQWSTYYYAADASGFAAATSNVFMNDRIAQFAGSGYPTAESSFVSLDADGFTINNVVVDGTAKALLYVCLAEDVDLRAHPVFLGRV